MRIEDQEVEQLRDKEISLVKVSWGGPIWREYFVGAGDPDEGILFGSVFAR